MSEQVQTAERTPTAAETAANARRRGQAVAGAAAGAAVVAVLVAVFVGIQLSGNDQPTASSAPASAPAAAAATPDAIEPSAAAPTKAPAQAPQPVSTDPALQKPPTLNPGGTAKLTKLVVQPLIKGKGPKVKAGQTLTVNYVLGSFADGKKIESSWDAGQPVQFPIGVGQLIKGWDQGLPGQTVGSRVQLDVPAALAYGPDKGDLRFVVDILAAQ